jgi:hypothetical protein
MFTLIAAASAAFAVIVAAAYTAGVSRGRFATANGASVDAGVSVSGQTGTGKSPDDAEGVAIDPSWTVFMRAM